MLYDYSMDMSSSLGIGIGTGMSNPRNVQYCIHVKNNNSIVGWYWLYPCRWCLCLCL